MIANMGKSEQEKKVLNFCFTWEEMLDTVSVLMGTRGNHATA